ncbi:MAG TPA: ATP-dependent DNA helicase [Xanthomonadales bacterium]|nr:ATP-dependent DNA helicase [Xanthomonadales bacterium]
MKTSSQILGENSPFAGLLPGFAPRAEQIRMAEAVERMLDENGTLVVEAGTGIGKTLAYLVPALRSGERTIVSTGTKTLQDQLFFRDLPVVLEALGLNISKALLKGRGNYLCLHRMELARSEGRLPSREAVSELEAVFDWSARSSDGDLSIAPVITEESGLMPLITSTADNCLGSDCPRFDRCFVALARRQAQEADIVVVNHHLLFADMAIKQSGFGEVLPGAAAFIVDEAHQAPETALRFFSVSLSSRQVEDLCRDITSECADLSGALASLRVPLAGCLQKTKELQSLVAERLPDRGSWTELVRDEAIRGGLQELDHSIVELRVAGEAIAGRSHGMDSCIERVRNLHACLDQFDAEMPAGEVRWFERRGSGFTLHITPLEVSSPFNHFREASGAAWLFTSATLAVGGDFSHFTHQLGLQDAATLQLDSPFDYPAHALLWLPENLPEPRDAQFVERLLDLAVPLLEASRGRAFLLFTSHRSLRRAAELLAERVDFPLFVQGERPRSLLLEEFRASGNGVLLGSASFWEGVDVIGPALSLVLIDKLPFAPPDDPVIEARSELLRRAGGNPFMQLFLPEAVIALKQGAGRLIRDVNDQGVLVICDPRIRTRSYGRIFLDSLPPMRLAQGQSEVEQFLHATATGD